MTAEARQNMVAKHNALRSSLVNGMALNNDQTYLDSAKNMYKLVRFIITVRVMICLGHSPARSEELRVCEMKPFITDHHSTRVF